MGRSKGLDFKHLRLKWNQNVGNMSTGRLAWEALENMNIIGDFVHQIMEEFFFHIVDG
ncbi:hypothetical protein Syun_006482 [Stephania yunnanensis]|uniref:Uncharacterized protein n=1 Tax=Stephania yunnanensis TaxID=152371 RepID=A0AAP0KWY7_9MAGN